jgi:hypothetical protein
MSASVVVNPDRFFADLVSRQPRRELSPAGYRRKLKAAGLLPTTKKMIAKAVRAPKPRRPQFRIDFESWERYLTARAIAEAIYAQVSGKSRECAAAPQRRDTLYDRLCALEHIAEDSLVA